MIKLPINEVLDELKDSLDLNARVILQAPPGAGKSTRVPISLLDSPWLKDKIIIMLEPRRVAARMVASQMAKLLDEELGQRVGYQVKQDSVYSKETKILVVTEAILVRMLQADQSLESIGLIIFDEFHERSIHSDLSLALSLQVQELLRDDLKLLIMSATLNTEKISKLLGEVPVISSKGKSYDVAIEYLDIKTPQADKRTAHQLTLKSILKAVKNDEGDILVFLQGLKEIHKLQSALNEAFKNSEILILPLYSSLSKNEQDKALLASNKRKIILSTNIAQTSVTIEGVKVVIDTGLEKLSRFNYAKAMNHLESTFISKDSATQRTGRAGRVSDGKCYRLWHEQKVLLDSTKPEILRSDLSALLLELALWGVKEFEELIWLDIPSKDIVMESKVVLQELEMLDKSFKITSFGKDALSLGLHPRFSYMILKSEELGYVYEACLLSALLAERDILKNSYKESDLLSRFTHLYEKDLDSSYINLFTVKEVLKQSEFFYKRFKKIKGDSFVKKRFEFDKLAVLLLLAYPDRLAASRAKNDNRYKLSNGKGAVIDKEDSLFNEEYLVVSGLHAHAKDSFINQALSIDVGLIEEYFSHLIETRESVSYNADTKKFDIREKQYFLDLELSSKPLALSQKHNMKTLLIGLLKEEGLKHLTWSKKAKSLQERVIFVNAHQSAKFKSFEEKTLVDTIDIWLEAYLDTIKSVKELENLDLYPLLLSLLTYDQQQELEKLAPYSVKVPSGSNVFINYSDSMKPAISVKIQEIFGLSQTPKVLNDSIDLQIHLLSPAMRPIQITYDLNSFWKNSYEEVRKELRGKYKKHYWPENPYEAIATKKTKKHMKI